MKFDDIIAELGEFGPYQKRVYFLACLVAIPAALETLVGVFTMATPKHRCRLSELPNDTYHSQGPWHADLVAQSVPWDVEADALSPCSAFVSNTSSTEQATNQTQQCSRWVYSHEVFKSTFTSEVDMVCDRAILSTYANMVFMMGFLVGSLVFGTLSDLIGRKKVLMVCILGQFASSLSIAFCHRYVVFIVLRALTAAFGMGTFLSAFVVGMEIVGPSKRRIVGLVVELVYTLGLLLLALLAYTLRHWRHLQIACALPSLVTLILLGIFLPESPRWLIQRGRYQEASRIIRKAAAGNGVQPSEQLLDFANLEDASPGEHIWGMFKSPALLLRCSIVFFNWMVASLVYYGLSLNVGSLSGNIYLNFTLYAVVEAASYVFCLGLLDRMGRRSLLCFSMLLAGLACLAQMLPVMLGDESVQWVTITLSLIGKFGASAAFAIVYVYTAEVFPTTMRNSGMGLSSFSARVGGIIAPYIANLGKVVSGDMGVALPLILLGGAPLAAGLLTLLLPALLSAEGPEECVHT